MSGYLRVRNWERFQHYHDRRPIWIKVYVELVNPTSDYMKLSLNARGLLPCVWLLAAEWNNAIPNDSEFIANRLRTDPEACREALAELLKSRWILETKTPRRASNLVPQKEEVDKEKKEPTRRQKLKSLERTKQQLKLVS